jgi:hypothetical protein
MRTFSEKFLECASFPSTALGGAFDAVWITASAHLGPHDYSPMKKSLEGIHSAGLLLLMNSAIAFAVARLPLSKPSFDLQLLMEAIFCYQIDPIYLVPHEEFRFMPLTEGAELSDGVARTFYWIFFTVVWQRNGFWPTYPPVTPTAQALNLARFTAPKADRAFSAWTSRNIQKIAEVAQFPDARKSPLPATASEEERRAESVRAMGTPLAPAVLMGATGIPPDDFLAWIDWKTNPLLRAPDSMIQSGFQGDPYGFRS